MLPSMVWWHGRYGNFFRKDGLFWGSKRQASFFMVILKYVGIFFLCLELNEYFRAHIYNF